MTALEVAGGIALLAGLLVAWRAIKTRRPPRFNPTIAFGVAVMIGGAAAMSSSIFKTAIADRQGANATADVALVKPASLDPTRQPKTEAGRAAEAVYERFSIYVGLCASAFAELGEAAEKEIATGDPSEALVVVRRGAALCRSAADALSGSSFEDDAPASAIEQLRPSLSDCAAASREGADALELFLGRHPAGSPSALGPRNSYWSARDRLNSCVATMQAKVRSLGAVAEDRVSF